MDIAAQPPFPSQPPDAPEIAGRRIDWTGRDVLFGILWFIGSFAVLPISVIAPLALFYDTHDFVFQIVEILIAVPLYALIVSVAVAKTFKRYGGGWERLGVSRPRLAHIWWALGALVGALTVSLVYGSFVQYFDIGFLSQDCGDQIPREFRDNATLLALAALAAVLFAPIAEELFFRGFVFTGIARSFGIPAGIVGSGFLFGAAHLVGNPVLYKSLIQFWAIGMIFAFAYWKSQNILATIAAHFTFNLLGIILIASTTCQK